MSLYNIYLPIHWNSPHLSMENMRLTMEYLYLYVVRFFRYLNE